MEIEEVLLIRFWSRRFTVVTCAVKSVTYRSDWETGSKLRLEMTYIQNKGSPQGNQKPAVGRRPRNLKQKHEKSLLHEGSPGTEQIDHMEEFL